MDGSRDMSIRIEAAGVMVEFIAEAVSWAPDVAEDMVTRAVSAFTATWNVLEATMTVPEAEE